MKNTIKSLILALLFFISHLALYGQSETIMYLDIPNLDGEYTLPNTRPVVTAPGPKQKNILIKRYNQLKTNSVIIGNLTGGARTGKSQGTEMELFFSIDQSIIELSTRLFNKTVTPFMNLYIDSPAINSDPQRERMRIKLTNVRILSINHFQDSEGIPTYSIKIKFDTNLMGIIIYNFNNNTHTVNKYCWDYDKNKECINSDF